MTIAWFLLLIGLPAIAAGDFVIRRRRTLRVLLLGTGPYAALVAREIEARPRLRCKILGVVEEPGVRLPVALAGIQRLGAPAQLAEIVEGMRPDRIVVAITDRRRGQFPALDLLGHQLRGVVVEEASEVYERFSGKLAIETLQPGSQLFRDSFRRSEFQDQAARGVSLSAGLVGLFLCSPLLVLIALAIKLDSRGPVLFRQQRVGLGGRPFQLFKFRTMRAAEVAASEWIVDNRGRVTRVGALLRRLRLDELPQFVNLILGDMNLVGPRPHPVSNFILFNERIPFYSLRCLVRPGLTGWAQIRYRYANNLAEETEKMRYDLYYIKHRSVWLDLTIIPATMHAVLAGRGATGQVELVLEEAPTLVEVVPALVVALALPALRGDGPVRLDWIPCARVRSPSAAAVRVAGR